MLTNHGHITVQTERDLTSGATAYLLPFSLVPVITAAGPAPGHLRVAVGKEGRVREVQAALTARAAQLAPVADVLARVASFELDPGIIEKLPGETPMTLTFELDRAGLDTLAGLIVKGPEGLGVLLDAPVLGDVLAFQLVDLRVGG
ncbi:MAG: hypothetical protein VKP62_06675 [Candidatus Sericytochromatia bacterium]|nr:hypothetical protein [Candidatus Sericytochromatia bacterium]